MFTFLQFSNATVVFIDHVNSVHVPSGEFGFSFSYKHSLLGRCVLHIFSADNLIYVVYMKYDHSVFTLIAG